MVYKLKAEYVEQIKSDPHLLAEVSVAADSQPSTILTWCRKGSPYLTLAAVLTAIMKYNDLDSSAELIEEEKVAA